MMKLTLLPSISRRWLLLVFAMLCGSTAIGCSLCCSPYDNDYGTFGTRTPRADMRYGRVGSIFSDPALVGQRDSTTLDVVEYPENGSEMMMDDSEEGTIIDGDG